MKVDSVVSEPIKGQKPGTSGLRKKTRQFMERGFLENFVQSIFSATGGAKGKSYVVGGDGRFFNKQAIQIIIKMAAANGAAKLIIGQDGLLATPAASHLIRLNKTDGGLILSASHNPGGIDQDFGIKFNTPNGGPSAQRITDAIYNFTKTISQYFIVNADDIDLSKIGITHLGNMKIEIVDPVSDYKDLMETLFDFDKIKALFASGFSMQFDAMHAVTGPYAKAILEDCLGAPKGTVINGIPLPDFGNGHPDPNPVWAKPLVDFLMSEEGPDFGAASDGDGDRNMILGKGIYITPSDSLAVLAANIHLAKGYTKGISGIARSMPTSGASDRVAKALGIECYETPTGWKFFGNLLDAGKVGICGEESAGTGSDHVREKDGLWAVLLWLNILAVRKQSVAEIMQEHWSVFGRNYYSRHDYENLDTATANSLINALIEKIANLKGQEFCGLKVIAADDFSYNDPVDNSLSSNQGIRIFFEGEARVVLRLSGTGTQGATLRVYLEQYTSQDGDHSLDPQIALKAVIDATNALVKIEHYTSRKFPDVTT
ncbi:MAG: alpha-D-glucose phosphate-specific phosphoglucomutase [Rhizobiales bacterium]|nr:alpha-D-glucose phosphate-specific phosphoglucomutase [Hyphomicrobiales bacterium]